MMTKEVYEEQKALSDRWKAMYYEKKNELDQLTNNWNELKEYLKERIKFWEEQEQKWIEAGWMKFGGEANSKIIYQGILDKMKEIKDKCDKMHN